MDEKELFISIRECQFCTPDVWQELGDSVGPFRYKCKKCNSTTDKVIIKRGE